MSSGSKPVPSGSRKRSNPNGSAVPVIRSRAGKPGTGTVEPVRPGQASTPELEAERRAKIRAGHRRFWDDTERSAKARAAVTGPQTAETRRRKSEAMQASWARRKARVSTEPGGAN